jgi:ATP-dependent DNA helicase RecG
MTRAELIEIIKNGENSGVEFKLDDIRPEKLAEEMAALLNLEGGHIILGVANDGTVSGLTRDPKRAEEWVMEVARTHVRPRPIPFWETIEWEPGRLVGIVSLPADAPDKPYKAKRGSAWVTQVRVGTTTRDASDEEELRLYQQSGRLQYDRKPVPGSSFDDLDLRRLTNYFQHIRQQLCPAETDRGAWTQLLLNTELMIEDRGRQMASAGGLILFGIRPNKFLPQAGITAVAYPGNSKDYAAKERASLRGPVVSLFAAPAQNRSEMYPEMLDTPFARTALVEAGVIEQALDFVRRNIRVTASIDKGGRRQEVWDYPMEAVREAIVNAIAHRDYTITVADVELSIYADRMEIISPGRLPNTVTVEKMRAGYRASRNELIKEILRDYRYIEATGMGVPRKIIAGMRAHNGTEPDLIEEADRFIVRLWREPHQR